MLNAYTIQPFKLPYMCNKNHIYLFIIYKLSLINAEIRLLCRQGCIYNLKTFNVFGKSSSPEFFSFYAVDKWNFSSMGTLKLAEYFEGKLLKYKN